MKYTIKRMGEWEVIDTGEFVTFKRTDFHIDLEIEPIQEESAQEIIDSITIDDNSRQKMLLYNYNNPRLYKEISPMNLREKEVSNGL